VALTRGDLENPGTDLHFLREHIQNHLKSREKPKRILDPQEEANEIILAYPSYIRMRTQDELHHSLELEAYRQYKNRVERNERGDKLSDWYHAVRNICDNIFEYHSFEIAMRRTA